MKKEYTKPIAETVHIAITAGLLAASNNNVNEYQRGNDILVGDDDEPKAQNIWPNEKS